MSDKDFFEECDRKVGEYDRAIVLGEEMIAGLKDQRASIRTIRDLMVSLEANSALYQGKIEEYQEGK